MGPAIVIPAFIGTYAATCGTLSAVTCAVHDNSQVPVHRGEYVVQYFIDALKGSEVVLGALGSNSLRNAEVFTKAYPEIVRGMQKANVKRLVFVSACYDHEGAPCFYTCCIKPLFLSKIYSDIANFDQFLKTYKGPVQYTNLRPFEFSNGKRKKYKMVQAYTEASTGWTYETNLIDLSELMIEVYQKRIHINKGVDVGNYE